MLARARTRLLEEFFKLCGEYPETIGTFCAASGFCVCVCVWIQQTGLISGFYAAPALWIQRGDNFHFACCASSLCEYTIKKESLRSVLQQTVEYEFSTSSPKLFYVVALASVFVVVPSWLVDNDQSISATVAVMSQSAFSLTYTARRL